MLGQGRSPALGSGPQHVIRVVRVPADDASDHSGSWLTTGDALGSEQASTSPARAESETHI
jgi:hypothetical protein